MFDQKVHGPKQVIVVYLPSVNAWKVDALNPVEDMEFGHWVKKPVGNKNLEICDHVKVESAASEVFFDDFGPAELFPNAKDCKGCPEILADLGGGRLRSMIFNFKEPFERIDHPQDLLCGVFVSRTEVHDDVLANLSLPGTNTFDQVKGLVSLVATFSGSCSQIYDATILMWRILSRTIGCL